MTQGVGAGQNQELGMGGPKRSVVEYGGKLAGVEQAVGLGKRKTLFRLHAGKLQQFNARFVNLEDGKQRRETDTVKRQVVCGLWLGGGPESCDRPW